MMPDVATLKNAYRDRPPRSNAGVEEDPMKIPQSFTFMQREGLSFSNNVEQLHHELAYSYVSSV